MGIERLLKEVVRIDIALNDRFGVELLVVA